MADNERVPFPERKPREEREDLYQDTPDFGIYPDCPECGCEMGFSFWKTEWKCPNCGHISDLDEAMELCEDEDGDDEKPFVCRTCGGPWPECQTACKMFDD